MKPRTRRFGRRAAALAICAGALTGAAAWAQGPMPGGPMMDGGPMMGGRPMMGPPPPSTAASVPLSALAAGLGLSDDQKDKIAQIQQHFLEQRGIGGPRFGGPMDGPRMGDPGDQQASASIKAVLTGRQAEKLPGFLTEVDDLRFVGIPAQMLGELNLSDTQVSKIEAIAQQSMKKPASDDAMPDQGGGPQGGRRAAHEQAVAALTAAQKLEIQQFGDLRPGGPERMGGGPGGQGMFGGQGRRRGQGGPEMGGGPMGGPGGQFGGPPAGGPGMGGPDGGMGGPPPPDDGGAPPPDGGGG